MWLEKLCDEQISGKGKMANEETLLGKKKKEVLKDMYLS